MVCVHASSSLAILAASSMMTRPYLRPRELSGSISVHTSMLPPVISSSRFSVSFFAPVTPASVRFSSRQASEASL